MATRETTRTRHGSAFTLGTVLHLVLEIHTYGVIGPLVRHEVVVRLDIFCGTCRAAGILLHVGVRHCHCYRRAVGIMRLRTAVDELRTCTVLATSAAHRADVIVILVGLAVLVGGRIFRALPVPLVRERLRRGAVVLLVAPHLRVTEAAGRNDTPRVFRVDVCRNRTLRADGCLRGREGIELQELHDAPGGIADTDGTGGILRALTVDALLEVPQIDLAAVGCLVILRTHGTPFRSVDGRRRVRQPPSLGGRVRLVIPADAYLLISRRERAEHGGEIVAGSEHIIFLHAYLSVLADARRLVIDDIGMGVLHTVLVEVLVILDDGLLPDEPSLHLPDTAVGVCTGIKSVEPLGVGGGPVPAGIARHGEIVR